MIDILIPVLNRPQRVTSLLNNIWNTTEVPYRILFLCTEGDAFQISVIPNTEGILILSSGPGEYPRKINEGYRWTDNTATEHFPYVFNASDDLEFTPGWDTNALHLMHGEIPGKPQISVVATNDKANSQVRKGQFGTHCLIRRSYIDEHGGSLDGPGLVFHEGYDHNFVDRELCHLAQSRGEFAYAKNSVVKHHHPLHDSHVQMDATYRKGLAGFHQDQLLFFQRAAEWGYVGLNPQERRVARNRLAKT